MPLASDFFQVPWRALHSPDENVTSPSKSSQCPVIDIFSAIILTSTFLEETFAEQQLVATQKSSKKDKRLFRASCGEIDVSIQLNNAIDAEKGDEANLYWACER